MPDEDEGGEVIDLAGAAEGALGDGEQDHLPGTDHARVKFKSMAWDTLEAPPLRDEITLIVRGMVVGHGEEVMADGEIRTVATIKVLSVVPAE